jgi:hypothetical protein
VTTLARPLLGESITLHWMMQIAPEDDSAVCVGSQAAEAFAWTWCVFIWRGRRWGELDECITGWRWRRKTWRSP